MTRGYGRMWRGARRGQVMPLFALIIMVLMGGLVLGVDLSRLRAEAESVQRAANAAALAGVVYLPDFADSAYTRASEEAKKNGFVSGQRGVTVTPSRVPNYDGRLKVTISEPVPLAFGGVFGLIPQTVNRSATAEFDLPLQLGAPDYVLGYPKFPTSLTSSGTDTQGFYLIARGPYGLQENGDAYSQYFESYNGGYRVPSGKDISNDYNPCTLPTDTTIPTVQNCSYLTANPDVKRIGGFTDGYDYVVDNPTTQTVVLKIFDPYDEGAFQNDGGGVFNSNVANSGSANNGFPDQWGCNSGNTNFCRPKDVANVEPFTNTSNTNYFPTALQFSLSGPYQTLVDTSQRTITATPTISVTGTSGGYTCATDCVISAPFTAGDDPTHAQCPQSGSVISCSGKISPYAYKFLNYAIIHQGIYHIHVRSVPNVGAPFAGVYGAGGNVFALAACADTNRTLGTPTDPSAGGVHGAAVSDPYGTSGWDPSSCTNPNAATPSCAYAGTAPPGGCVHIYAVQRMCIINILSNGRSLIPLGYVPPEYDGKTLQVSLYDIGDVSGGSNTISVLTPAGDPTHPNGTLNPPITGYPASLDYSFSGAPTDLSSGFNVTALTSHTASEAIAVTTNAGNIYNGSWLKINIPIVLPAGQTYGNMIKIFGGYWKVLYDVGGSGADTTTWEVAINGSPVHLLPGS
ncbi:MAG: pilus assembly protein TadG-related protein [Chloroflexota bacterium]|nr:pilus assembly protein TadG-related protein [Chloroflexota bacterium]